MGIYKASDSASSTLAGSLTNVATTLTVQAGHGDRFPQITGTDYTYLYLENTAGTVEAIKVTARTATADSMTIERAQLGTTAQAWASGDVIECRPAASLFQDSFNHVADTSAAHAATAISNTPAGNIAATTVQAALDGLDSEKLGLATGGTVSAATTFSSTLTASNALNVTGTITASNVANVTGSLQLDGAVGSANHVMTSSGSSATPTWSQVSLTAGVSGTLPVANGGTNLTSYAAGDIVYASDTTVLSKLTAAATGNVLLSGTSPSWGKAALTTHVSGILPVANGGTNSAYFGVTGPTTERTYTFPDADVSMGYINIPSQGGHTDSDYTFVIGDAGKMRVHAASAAATRTWTFPANASVAFPVGTALTFVNRSGSYSVTLAITSDTMYLAGTGGTGSRTLAPYGVATAIKTESNEWVISGTGLS